VQADAMVPDAGYVGASNAAALEAHPLVVNYAEAWGIVASARSWWHFVAEEAPAPAGMAVVDNVGEPYWTTRAEAMSVELLNRAAMQRAIPMEPPKRGGAK